MGIIGKQAARNSVSIVLGTILGAVNTILILPAAFASFPEGWGLLKVLLAYAMIFAQLFGFGAGNSFIRFSPFFKGKQLHYLRSFILSLPLIGMVILAIVFLLSGNSLIALVNEEDAYLLEDRLSLLFALTVILTMVFTLSGFIGSVFKSIFYQFMNELVIRVLYLGISLLYLIGWISFEQLVVFYVLSYGLMLLIIMIYSLGKGLRWSSPIKAPRKVEVLEYGLYSVLDKGASIIINNLDIIMISLLLDLERVAIYTLAFYIGSVVMIPQKALIMITNPMTSKAIAEDDRQELSSVYNKSVLIQFLIGASIFVAIWVNIDDIFLLLPTEFSYGKWVVLFIGLSKLFYLMSGVSGGMIVYSKHYKVNLYFNIALVAITVLTNLILIPKYQINGAALATAISLLLYNLAKMIFVRYSFKLHPINGKLLLGILFMISLALIGSSWEWKIISTFWTIAIKGSVFALLGAVLTYFLSEDVRAMVEGIRKKYLS